MLAVQACAQMTGLCKLFCQVLYMSNSLAAQYADILSADLAVLQTSVTVYSIMYENYC